MMALKRMENGFEYIEITNEVASAKIALQGAHLFDYRKCGEEPLIWLSSCSAFRKGKAIRGGIPVCWPWFGPHGSEASLPQHGFARTSIWELVAYREPDAFCSEIELRLQSSDSTLSLWPYRFELNMYIAVGTSLEVSLKTLNRDAKHFEITEALHTYFNVSDIESSTVHGLDGKPYVDKLSGQMLTQQGNLEVHQETDRIYRDVAWPLTIEDQERTITLDTTGSTTAVVWNPWKANSEAMQDMSDDGYRSMLCVESANVLKDSRIIKAGESHTLSLMIG